MNYIIIPEENKLIQKVFICFFLSVEIQKSSRKLAYFIHHLSRCKKHADIIKLTIKVAALLSYTAELTKQLINTWQND